MPRLKYFRNADVLGVCLTDKKSADVRNKKSPLPDPEIFRKWLFDNFSRNSNQHILLIDGYGEGWKAQKPSSVMVTACHADINSVHIKTFYRILLLREIASEYSVDPMVYIMALGDIARGFDPGGINEKVAQTSRFLREVFSPIGNVNTIVDQTEIQIDSIFKVLDFDRSLESILKQMRTPEELEKTQSFGEKGTHLTSTEKKLLRTYLFERRMMEEDSKKYPYISWGLEAQTELGVSYNIYDESNAGAAVLRKMVSVDNGKEYPGTIVLPDPLTISGRPMRYKSQRDLGDHDALFLSDPYRDVKRKLVDQETVSNEFLDYLTRNIIRPFASNGRKNEIDSLTNLKTQALFDRKKQLALKYYWEFIEPYYNIVERITGLHEGLFVPKGLVERVFDALGSKRNRTILQKVATYYHDNHNGMTADELSQQIGLSKTGQRSLYRNLRQLEECGLMTSVREGVKFKKYYVYSNKTLLQIRWPLLEDSEKATDK